MTFKLYERKRFEKSMINFPSIISCQLPSDGIQDALNSNETSKLSLHSSSVMKLPWVIAIGPSIEVPFPFLKSVL